LLHATLTHFTEAQSFYAQYGLDLEEKDKARLKLDMYFSEFHCFEAMFALMMAPFQPEPHCIYMCTYSARDIRQHADNYLAGNIASLTSNQYQTKCEFLSAAVYSHFNPSESTEAWQENLEDLARLLDRLAKKYSDALEYNFYKHGMRVSYGGPGSFKISSQEGNLEAQWDSDDSIRFMQIVGQGKEVTLRQTIKYFDPDESIHNVYLLEAIIKSMKATRLAKIIPNTHEFIVKDFRGVDKTRIEQFWAKDFSISLTVAKKEKLSSTQ